MEGYSYLVQLSVGLFIKAGALGKCRLENNSGHNSYEHFSLLLSKSNYILVGVYDLSQFCSAILSAHSTSQHGTLPTFLWIKTLAYALKSL